MLYATTHVSSPCDAYMVCKVIQFIDLCKATCCKNSVRLNIVIAVLKFDFFFQAVDGAAGKEAIQIISTLSQQGGQVGAELGSAGAAEAIVRATLAQPDIEAFQTHK